MSEEYQGLVMLANAGDKILPVSVWRSGGDTVSFSADEQVFRLTRRQLEDLFEWFLKED